MVVIRDFYCIFSRKDQANDHWCDLGRKEQDATNTVIFGKKDLHALKHRIHEHRMVRIPLANGLQTKCAYVWMELRTCTAPSANGSHTIRHETKFVGSLREHKEKWIRRVSCARLRFTKN